MNTTFASRRPLACPSRRTKIIATLGPATDTLESVTALAFAGVDAFRLNFSHGTLTDHQRRHALVRSAEQIVQRPLAVLADLQGPKIRIGCFREGAVELKKGDDFRLDGDASPGSMQRVCLPHPEVLASLTEGASLLLDDGRIRLRVRRVQADCADCAVEVGGRLSDRKGVNLPETMLQTSVMTPKDRDDLAGALAMGVDWIALSFVQSARDVLELKEQVRGRARIIAKIEKPQAIQNIHSIALVSDALMVARGDLAVESCFEDVPVLQRLVVNAARDMGRPVVVATQMLESMIHTPVPTRAEASDVATAVWQEVDAVMLSAETASGSDPQSAVAAMDRIIRRTEKALASEPKAPAARRAAAQASESAPEVDVIACALRAASSSTELAATVTYTTGGASALKVARERPLCPIVCITPAIEVARWLNLVWGVHPVVSSKARGADDLLQTARELVSEALEGAHDRPVAVVGGLPFGTPGAINFLHVLPANGVKT